MFLTFLFFQTTAAFFTAENLVVTIVGFIVSIGLTNWIKNWTGLYGTGAAVLAFVLAFVVAVAALVISQIMGGTGFSIEALAASGLQIFALATMAYKLVLAEPAE